MSSNDASPKEQEEVARSALTLLVILKDVSVAKPERGQKLLASMYRDVFDILRDAPMSATQAAGALVLREYFNHRGDWAKSIECLSENVSDQSGKPPCEAIEVARSDAHKAQLRVAQIESVIEQLRGRVAQ